MSRSTLLIMTAAIAFTVFTDTPATAEYTAISTNQAKDAIESFNHKKQSLINSENFFHEAVDFYHERIHDRAVFNMTINDPRPDVPQQNIKLDKEKFLQGFLKEGQRLDSYRQDYRITDLQNYGQNDIFMVKEQIQEDAIIPPMGMGKKKSVTFSAATNCTSYYQVQGGQAVQLGSDCETTIAFPKEI